MANDSINRVTVYRLKLKTHQGFVLKDYDKVHEGSGKADGQSYKFWLYFLRQNVRPAGWYKVFESLPLTLPPLFRASQQRGRPPIDQHRDLRPLPLEMADHAVSPALLGPQPPS